MSDTKPSDVDGLIYRLQRSAEIQASEKTALLGRPATSDRAVLMLEAATTLAAQQAELDRLAKLARANNDLARHEANARRELQAENARLRDALEPLAEGRLHLDALDVERARAALKEPS